MRPSGPDRRIAACAAATLAYLACSPPPPQAPQAVSPAPVVIVAPPPPAPAPAPRRKGRTLLAEPRETALRFVVEPVAGGRSALAVAQLAGERDAWVRRLDGAGAGPLLRFADRHVVGAFDLPSGTTTFVTSDGARLCFGVPALSADRPCIQSSPAAIVPVGDRLALLELTTMRPPEPASARAPRVAPRPRSPRRTQT